MRLYVVRHAEAAAGDPDELRRLTNAGRETARALGKQLAAEGIHPEVVLSSPLLRARETAAEIAKATGAEAEADERLAPGAGVDEVLAAVDGRGGTVVIVGHQPDCGNVVAALSGGPEPSFPPGGVAVLDVPD